MNNKGQSVLAEHVMIFFVVIAALVAMTTYVQRGLEARIHDARNFMINQVMDNNVCDANCLAATGNQISYEYEPYYSQQVTDSQSNSDDQKTITQGAAIGDILKKTVNENTQATSISVQLPPACADGANPKPSFCP